MDANLLELLVCPVSKGPLVYMRDEQELWCAESQLAYPIKDHIPMMLAEEARTLSVAELGALRN